MTPDKIDFSKYDLVHVGVSGGKDSAACLLWAVNESGIVSDKIRASFCDTGNEHQITYDYVRMLSEKVFPIKTIIPPLDFYALAKKKGRFPSVKSRFCTQQLKIFPSQKYILELQSTGANVLLLSGVRAAESKKRAGLPQFAWDEYYACDIYRPLFNLSTVQSFAYLSKYGIARNALYDYGAKRVGCLPCIMSRKSEIRMIAKNFPERIDMIRKAELETGKYSSFFHADFTPESFRSKTIETPNGIFKVNTIDDVVEWSKTKRGGKQFDFDFDMPYTCNSNLGACE